jgi:UDP-N-acetylmuramyl pentapeptide phosphotransferase/UDP-N-acetylglucosamine-1-phosphate transferase
MSAVVSIVSTIFSYFSPAKSPFYAVIAFGTTSLVFTCHKLSQDAWWFIYIPLTLVLGIALKLSLKDRAVFSESENSEQIRFARSFSVSTAMLALVYTAREVDNFPIPFFMNYAVCIFQIVIFLLYTWARSNVEEKIDGENFVQICLITSTFLIGASYANTEYVGCLISYENDPNIEVYCKKFFIVSCTLYAMWMACIIFWIRHLSSLIKIHIPGSGN